VNVLVKHPRSGLPATVLYNLSYLQLQLQLLYNYYGIRLIVAKSYRIKCDFPYQLATASIPHLW